MVSIFQNRERRAAAKLAAASVLIMVASSTAVRAQNPVLTRSYDDARTGANTQEATLTPNLVTQRGMKRVRRLSIPDDPRVEAQPLYVPRLTMTDGHPHDVVFACSMGNTAYAFDADSGALLWKKAIGSDRPIAPRKPHHGDPDFDPNFPNRSEIDLWGTNKLWGVLSTPVIDIDTNTLYVVNWASPDGTTAQGVFRLNALDIVTGNPRRPPLVIQATAPIGTPPAQFDPALQKQRAALLLVPLRQTGAAHVPKTLFMACGLTKETANGHHGWVLAFDLDSFRQTAAWCSTPTTQGGGIWHAGAGPAADAAGNVYVITANGGFNGDTAGASATDFAECFVRLRYTPPATPGAAGSLTVDDWWSPFKDKGRLTNEPGTGYDFTDQDLGSGGPVVTPGTGLLLGAGKDGVLYVFDKNDLGKKLADFTKLKSPPIFFTYFRPDIRPTDKLDSNFGGKTHHLHASPIFWESPDRGGMLFDWGENENLRAWTLDPNGKPAFLAKSNEVASQGVPGLGGMPGGMLTVSANGSQAHTGIVWATAPINGDANKHVVAGILRAYDATQFNGGALTLLWDSHQFPFTYDKFCPPVVADGRVLVPTYDGHVDIYKLN